MNLLKLCFVFFIGLTVVINAQSHPEDLTTTNSLNQPITLIETQTQNMTTSTSTLSYAFKIGDEKKIRNAGYFGNGIRPFVESNPEALAEWSKFKKKRVVSVIGYTGTFAFMGLGLAIGLNKDTGEQVYDPREGKTINKKSPKPLGLTMIGLSVVSLIVGGYNYFSAGNHMIESVQIYNSNLTSDNSSKIEYKLLPEIRSDKALISLHISW